jgi:metal-responsive CopG/Arc/MetJ family transcriptional regulator
MLQRYGRRFARGFAAAVRSVLVCNTHENAMRETITVSLPQDLKEALDRVVEEEGVSRSDVVRDSLRDYLFIRRFRALRVRMMARARTKGLFTDEDVFDRVS